MYTLYRKYPVIGSNRVTMVDMKGSKYLVLTLKTHTDSMAKGRKIYISKGYNTYSKRIYLLSSGELVLADFVNYGGDLPLEVKQGKCFGEGIPHYCTVKTEEFRYLTPIKEEPNIREDLINMKKAVVKMDDTSGCYSLLQGEELVDILLGAKGVT